jgi:hypothetical protein
MEKTKITFLVSTTSPDADLGFEAWLNNQQIVDIDHITNPIEVSVPVPDDEAEHVLKLVLKGKRPEHTVINESGEIVADSVLEIRDLLFDGIPLGQIINEKTVYTHDFNGHGVVAQHQFFGVMGCNGTAELRFTTPVYLWLLEHM